MRNLCDPIEAGGRGFDPERVASMTIWTLTMFSIDKKALKEGTSCGSFAEARAIWQERKKRGKQKTR